MKVRNRFAKGSGCYRCMLCGKLTWSTGSGDREHVRQCEACFDAAGRECSHQDGHHDETPDPQCPMCTGVAPWDKKEEGVTK